MRKKDRCCVGGCNKDRRYPHNVTKRGYVLTLMKLRLDLLQQGLAIRFDISTGKVSQIFITWIRLISHELGFLIIWPSRQEIRNTLPKCFQKFYPKCRTIIDCTEIFRETPSSQEAHYLLWSDYKHHATIKILVYNRWSQRQMVAAQVMYT